MKTLVKQWFGHVRADGTWCIQLSAFARHGETNGYSKTLESVGETSFPGKERLQIKNNKSLEIAISLPGKEQLQIKNKLLFAVPGQPS